MRRFEGGSGVVMKVHFWNTYESLVLIVHDG